ncbi:TetR/AcrR family transcriptional regulator [Aquisphaera insulae]|uniref:TetR/AcrR family transcriptional regulator n=1 Tax=Aquisphaera insulae TaxID=2712864 RepID=UPI0013EC18FB|nr:TetR/AcrR family transcriptional regulator [Aquisphaera insulae]
MRVSAETKAATRRRILEVARGLFGGQGFDATTTRDIARSAGIAAGTLFNYFATKEAIVEDLVGEAHAEAVGPFAGGQGKAGSRTLEEELFALVAAVLRKLAPYRAFLPAVMETTLSPLAMARDGESPSLRVTHLEAVVRIASRHGRHEALSGPALQIYWTLFAGVLAFWAKDRSPREEDTLALLDQSLEMFVGWLNGQRVEDARSEGGR